MPSGVVIQVNTANYIPGSAANQREAAVSSMANYLPVGTFLQSAFGADKQYSNKILASADSILNSFLCTGFVIIDNRVYIENEDGLEYLFTCKYKFDKDAVWSSVSIEGDTFLCLGGIAVWMIEEQTQEVTEVTGGFSYVPFYITSFGLRLVIGVNDTISWSSETDRFDFSSVGSGAGSQAINVLGANGKLMALGTAPNGFVVYTTRGILVAASTGDTNIPFSFQTSILSGYVIDNSYAQTSGVGYKPMAVFKGRGLCSIQIATDQTMTAVVETVNPFVGQSEELRDSIRLYNFFSGYLCVDTATSWHFIELGSNIFGQLPKVHWALLVPNSSKALDKSGNLFELSMKSNTVVYGESNTMIDPDNVLFCDIDTHMDAVVYSMSSTQSPVEGRLEQFVRNMDMNVYDSLLDELLPDGIDANTVPTTPMWGEDYQRMWELVGNCLPVKLDQHTEVDVPLVVVFQPDDDYLLNAVWNWADDMAMEDEFSAVYPEQAYLETVQLNSEATFTGIRANEANANLQTRVVSVVVYENLDSAVEIWNCNLKEGLINCSIEKDSIWPAESIFKTGVEVDGKQFVQQRNGLYTGAARAENHKVTVRNAKVLSELRCTLLGGGIA